MIKGWYAWLIFWISRSKVGNHMITYLCKLSLTKFVPIWVFSYTRLFVRLKQKVWSDLSQNRSRPQPPTSQTECACVTPGHIHGYHALVLLLQQDEGALSRGNRARWVTVGARLSLLPLPLIIVTALTAVIFNTDAPVVDLTPRPLPVNMYTAVRSPDKITVNTWIRAGFWGY